MRLATHQFWRLSLGVCLCSLLSSDFGGSAMSGARPAVADAPGGVPKAPEDARLLKPQHLKYLGAFTLPPELMWGGDGLTLRPDGDPSGHDDFPGSLFVVAGKAKIESSCAPSQRVPRVAEVSIPTPVAGVAAVEALPQAKIIQAPAEATGGLVCSVDWGVAGSTDIRGIQYTSGRLVMHLQRKYNPVKDLPSVIVCNADPIGSNCRGIWHVGPSSNRNKETKSAQIAGDFVTAPQAWADQYTNGLTIASGKGSEGGGAKGRSQGPAIIFFDPFTDPPPQPLGILPNYKSVLYYPGAGWRNDGETPCGGDWKKIVGSPPMKEYTGGSDWFGQVWIDYRGLAGIISFGRRSIGRFRYRDGCTEPPACNPKATGFGDGNPCDCNESRGWHGEPYVYSALYYDPEELGRSARGKTDPWKIQPYANDQTFADHWYDTCFKDNFGADWDRRNGLVYVGQVAAQGWRVIHVYRITPDGRQD
jgi:hypothetical protein